MPKLTLPYPHLFNLEFPVADIFTFESKWLGSTNLATDNPSGDAKDDFPLVISDSTTEHLRGDREQPSISCDVYYKLLEAATFSASVKIVT